jgi:hypothetical protein
MPQQVGDLIEAAADVGDVAAERAPQLMRADRGANPVRRVRSHRRRDRLAETG